MTTKRTKIPSATEGLLIYKSDMQCCVCQKKGDHIHHLDSKPNNNNIDNLAFLCFDHHNLATIKGSLSKTLKKEVIIEYRKHHYQVIENKRQQALGALNNAITELTDEKLLTVTKTALIILELENVKTKYFSAEWDKRSEIMSEIDKYVNHTNNRLAYDILDFLSFAASQTRGGMTENVASSIFGHILAFYPHHHEEKDRKQEIELARLCIHIGDSIAYDAFIHLRKISIAIHGLTIIKFIYRKAKENNIQEIKDEVAKTYSKLMSTLQRPERTDLGDAQEMLQVFRDDLEEWDLSFPMLPPHLMTRLDSERK